MYNKRFLLSTRILLVVQIVFSVLALVSLGFVSKGIMAIDKPTPTCPHGIEIYSHSDAQVPLDIGRKCVTERFYLYTPEWARSLSRVAVPAYLICFTINTLLIVVANQNKLPSANWQFLLYPTGVLFYTLMFHQFVFPNDYSGLLRYIFLGIDYVWLGQSFIYVVAP